MKYKVTCLFLLGSLMAAPGRACKCIANTPLELAGRADAVFIGEITEGSFKELPGGQGHSTFKVQEIFKGTVRKEVAVEYDIRSSCGYSFEAGRAYLIYAINHNPPLDIQQCSGTKPLQQANPDLVALRYVSNEGMPKDVIDFRERSKMCNHWGGEESYDAARFAEIQQSVKKLRCDTLDEEEKALISKYSDQKRIADNILNSRK